MAVLEVKRANSIILINNVTFLTGGDKMRTKKTEEHDYKSEDCVKCVQGDEIIFIVGFILLWVIILSINKN